MSLTQFFKYYIINQYLYRFFKCNKNVIKMLIKLYERLH